MSKPINERYIRVSGRTPVKPKKDLQLCDDVVFAVKGEVIKEERLNNQDGTIDIVWVVKPLDVQLEE